MKNCQWLDVGVVCWCDFVRIGKSHKRRSVGKFFTPFYSNDAAAEQFARKSHPSLGIIFTPVENQTNYSIMCLQLHSEPVQLWRTSSSGKIIKLFPDKQKIAKYNFAVALLLQLSFVFYRRISLVIGVFRLVVGAFRLARVQFISFSRRSNARALPKIFGCLFAD